MPQAVRQRVVDVRVRLANTVLPSAAIILFVFIDPDYYGAGSAGIICKSIILACCVFWAIRAARSATTPCTTRCAPRNRRHEAAPQRARTRLVAGNAES